MSDLLALSSNDDRIVENADWVELTTLLNADGNTSQEDVARAYHQAKGTSQARARDHAHDVFVELANRSSSCGEKTNRYPFTMSGDNKLLSRVAGHTRKQYQIYKFLLLVTRADMSAKNRTQAGIDATKVFERLCADVLRTFWGSSGHSDAMILGTAADGDNDGFEEAINTLCKFLCEGGGWKKGARKPRGGDGGLDVAVWRRFADEREGALVGFAQCKTGDNWRKSRTQLQSRAFCGDYMTDSLILDPIRIYMVPHCIAAERWRSDTRYAGLLVDRCRITEYSSSISGPNLDDFEQVDGRCPKEREGRDLMVKPTRNRFHSICPYFAMFPETFPDQWISDLTKPGDIVLDPFCGRGTTPFSALLLDRRAVASDVNDVAFCLTKAKTSAPKLRSLVRRIDSLEAEFDGRAWYREAEQLPEFFHWAFQKRTLQQLVYLRQTLRWRTFKTDGMVAALMLGSLHGEADTSSAYFSNQMPRTISTKPAYSIRFWVKRKLRPPIRDVFGILRQRASFRYESEPPVGDCLVLHRDVRKLAWSDVQLPNPIRCVVTSPPYFDVTNFEEDQWLRLWALGGPPYPTRGRVSRDDRHGFEDNYWRFLADMWRSLGKVLASRAHVIIRIGSSRISPERLVDGLGTSASFSQRVTELVHSEVSELRNRQTNSFLPGTKGCSTEVDCHFYLK